MSIYDKLKPGDYNNVDVSYPELSPTTPGALLGSREICAMSPGTIARALSEVDVPQEFVGASVQLHQVFYSSVYDGEPVVLSGLVTLPVDVSAPLPHLQYHHGTMMLAPFENGEGVLDAPSLYHGEVSSHPERNNHEARFFGLGCASQGYFVTQPDYTGYGIAVETEHPYTHHDSLGTQSAHMVLAGISFAAQLGIELEPGVFLMGWSEGGGAGLAAQKLLEASVPQVPVRASSLLAGPYHMSNRIGRFVLKTRDDESTSIYNWSVYVHNHLSDNPIAHESLWRYRVDNERDALRVPSNNPGEIYADDIKAHHEQLDALFEVSDLHTGWSPRGQIFLHSGKRDYIVPHAHSLSAVEGLSREGADIFLYEYEEDHYAPANDYFRRSLRDFGQVRQSNK